MRIAIVAAALGLITCTMGAAVGEQPKPKTHTVTIERMRFEPAMLTVARGDKIEWVNKDPVPHTATSTANDFDSKVIEAGKSWRYTPRTSGAFAYICTLHPTMKATLNVK